MIEVAKFATPVKNKTETYAQESSEHLLSPLRKLIDNLTYEVRQNNHKTNARMTNLEANLDAIHTSGESTTELSRLRQENEALKQENSDLLERVNNLSCILADLKTKADNAENEKLGLITTIRLLTSDNGSSPQVSTEPDTHITNSEVGSTENARVNNKSHKVSSIQIEVSWMKVT